MEQIKKFIQGQLDGLYEKQGETQSVEEFEAREAHITDLEKIQSMLKM